MDPKMNIKAHFELATENMKAYIEQRVLQSFPYWTILISIIDYSFSQLVLSSMQYKKHANFSPIISIYVIGRKHVYGGSSWLSL